MPTPAEFGTLLGKRALGKASARPNNPFYEEPQAAKPITLSGNVWTETIQIPGTAPVLADQQTSGVVKKWVDLALTAVAGSDRAFTNAALLNAVPFYWGDGSYNYAIKANGVAVAAGQNDWYLLDGVLTFNAGLAGLSTPITISFYEYVGRTLVESLNEAGKFQQSVANWEVDAGSVPLYEVIGDYEVESFPHADDVAVYTACNLGPNYKYIKPLKMKITYRMGTSEVNAVKLGLGCQFRTDDGFSTTIDVSTTTIDGTFTATADGNFHSRILTIPLQVSVSQLINLKLFRLGTDVADTHTGNFQVLSTILYQD